jgi:hypothetical protein
MDDSEATFAWNYRLVDRSDKNEGEPWVEIVEVYYEDDEPIGFSGPSVNAETKELLLENLDRIIKDIREQPVLKMADFKRRGT